MDEKVGIQNVLCMACLCVDRALNKLDNEPLKKYYLDALNEIPLLSPICIEPIVCWDCSIILKKCLAFRDQVKDSFRILQTYTEESLQECLLSDVSRPPRLRIHANEAINILPNNEIKIEFDEVTNNGDEFPKCDSDDDLNAEEIQSIPCDVKDEFNYPEDSVSSASETDRLSLPNNGEIKLEFNNGVCEDKHTISEDFKICSNSKEKLRRKKIGKKSVRHKNAQEISRNEEINEDNKTVLNLDMESFGQGNNEEINKSLLKERKMNRLRRINRSRRKSEIEEQTKKINTIQLTYDQMMAERLAISQNDSFINSKYKCASCLITFTKKSTYSAHVKNRHDLKKGNYTCPICQTILPSIERFGAHYKKHMKRYECAICKMRSNDAKTLLRHYDSAHSNDTKSYSCDDCGHVSSSVDQHRYHRDTHKRRIQCKDCDKTFTHRSGLMNHRISVHESKNEFPCQFCKKIFRWKASLKRHLEKHATTNQHPEAFCTQCGIGFASIASLQRHLKNSLKHVTPEQFKFICDHCKRRFADKTKLRVHIEDKHLHVTYQCYICHKVHQSIRMNKKKLPILKKDEIPQTSTEVPMVLQYIAMPDVFGV
ncbi:unnamed protein product [Colias eurytheme]|nr:unnamed protein product [Colias eurytheme]